MTPLAYFALGMLTTSLLSGAGLALIALIDKHKYGRKK